MVELEMFLLVVCYIAMGNHRAHRNRWFTYWKLVDLSMAMLNNQMVVPLYLG